MPTFVRLSFGKAKKACLIAFSAVFGAAVYDQMWTWFN